MKPFQKWRRLFILSRVILLPRLSQLRSRLGWQNEDARKILGELIEEAKTKYVSWLGIAYGYVGLGEKDHLLRRLELAYQQGALAWSAFAHARIWFHLGRTIRASLAS